MMIKNKILILMGGSVLTLVWFLWTTSYVSSGQWYKRPAECSTPKDVIKDMEKLLFLVNHTLTATFKIPYFLCYGTLWGVIRTGAILPWDNNIDVCVLDEDLSNIDENFFTKTFARVGVDISYNSRDGIYYMKYNKAVGEMTVFWRHMSKVWRAGWASRLRQKIPQDDPHAFPERLVQSPLPLADFIGGKFPVPHEQFEIMKYHYPDDWDIFGKPPGC